MLPVENSRKPIFLAHLFKYGFWLVFGFFLLFWFFLYSYHKYLQVTIRNRTAISSATGIDTLLSLSLGKTEQWILIRGQNRDNPILLVLHGGPGAPLFPFARDLGWKNGLEEHFTIIYWEQRGTGKSFHFSISPQSMNLSQMQSDALELTRFVKDNFETPRIFVLAKSWGSLPGIGLVQQKPQWIYAYIAIGQIVIPLKGDSLSYEYARHLAKRQHNLKAQHELEKIGYPPYDYKKLIQQRQWLQHLYGNENQENQAHSWAPFGQYLKILLATPEYSLLDIITMGFDPYFSLKHLWNERFYEINLLHDVKSVQVPVYFLCGRNDYVTPSPLLVEFYEKLDAPEGKYLFWFDKSGHQPEYTEPEKFTDIMVNQIKPSAFNPALKDSS